MEKKTNDAPPALVIRRTIHAKRERIFDAWTKPEMMREWFFPGSWSANTTNELRVGGSYKIEMIPDNKSQDPKSCGKDANDTNSVVHTGEYIEIDPPEKIVFTWNSPFVKDSRVTVELRDLGDSTDLTLTHELLGTELLRQQHTGGWDGCLGNLIQHIEKGKSPQIT